MKELFSAEKPSLKKRHFRPEGYTCKYCSRKFQTPSSLGAHVTAFHSRSPEVLEWVLKERANWKSEGRQCPYCPEKFYTPHSLGSHITTVHKAQVEENIARMKQKDVKA